MSEKDLDSSMPNRLGGQPKHSVLRLLLLLAAIVAIAGIMALIWAIIPAKYKFQASSPLTNLYTSMRDGDLQGALTIFRTIQDDPRASPEEKAAATLNALGAEYRISRNPSALLNDVRNLKRGIVDEAVSPSLRARLIAALAAQYAVSGSDPAVFTEIYLDAPFNTYLVPGDAWASSRNLYEWSYSISPTANAAINIARFHSDPVIPREGRKTWTMTDTSATETVRYLGEADRLSAEELANNAAHTESAQYFWYRYWRAIVIGRLADKLGDPYESQYRSEYDEFIAFAIAHPAVLAEEAVPFARFQYAIRLMQDVDRASAARQLNLLANELSGLQYPDTNQFAVFLRNVHKSAPDGNAWKPTWSLTQISPEFKAAVETVVGASIQL